MIHKKTEIVMVSVFFMSVRLRLTVLFLPDPVVSPALCLVCGLRVLRLFSGDILQPAKLHIVDIDCRNLDEFIRG